MKKIPYKTVEQQYQSWDSAYSENNDRGKTCILFALAGDQWDSKVESNREKDDKESLTFNHCLKHLKRTKAQGREIEFSLDLSPTTQCYQDNVEETNTFRLLLNSIILNTQMLDKFALALDKCVEYGYSFLEVNFCRENDQTLNYIPTVLEHQDPSVAFWDKNATHPTKIDGRFCGIRKKASKEETLSLLKKIGLLDKEKEPNYVLGKDNVIIDYWYRDYIEKNFIRLKTGVFKREDLLTRDDLQNIATKDDVANADDKTLVKKGEVCCIYYTRFCNNKQIIKPKLFPTDDLPLVKHPALTVWAPEFGEMTFPLIYHWMGAQKLHNYINSQIATMAKRMTGDKYFFGPEHIETQSQIEQAREINKRDGGFVLGGNVQTIRREMPSEIPLSIINVAQSSKEEIDEMSGVLTDSQTTDQTVLSGVALDKITHNMGIVNTDVMASHELFVKTIGRLVRQMIPRICSEERTLIVKRKDGSGEAIVINQDLGTGTIQNNIKDINDNFDYEIIAGPSSSMQKENTVRYLNQYYAINPNAAMLTGDIYMRNIDSPDSPELERRLGADIDPTLVKYSQGGISYEEYMQQKQKAQQAQQQQQAQMMMANPQFQSMMKMAIAEENKSKTQQFDAETKRITALSKNQNEQQKLFIEMLELLSKDKNDAHQQAIDQIRTKLEFNKQMLDGLKDAADTADIR